VGKINIRELYAPLFPQRHFFVLGHPLDPQKKGDYSLKEALGRGLENTLGGVS